MQAKIVSASQQALQSPQQRARVLIVDDDVTSRSLLEAYVTALEYEVDKAADGKEAMDFLYAHPEAVNVVLMDRNMPVMDGLTAVQRIKAHPQLKHIPVVMITASTKTAAVQEGIEAGAFYYLAKPVEQAILQSVLSAAVIEYRQMRKLQEELHKHRNSFNLIEASKFTFRTVEDASSLAAFIANCFPEPERVLQGLGELLINAVEHGILSIGYDLKTELVANGTWLSEIERMLELPEYRDIHATATLAHKENGTYVVIEDPGRGFDWRKYMRIDPARADNNHGRGIALANIISFDKLVYADNGRKAIGFVGHKKTLNW